MISTLEAIYRTLRIEVQDQHLAAAGRPVALFFDTVDVRRALLGMWDYVDNPAASRFTVRKEIFQQESALVAALLAAGWLGPFRMLPPHQAEILRQLDRNEAFSTTTAWRPAVQDRFFEALGLLRRDSDPSGDTTPPSLKDLSAESRRRFLRDQKDKAPQLFKAVQCVRYPWWQRLELWRREGDELLDLRSLGLDIADLTERPEFNPVAERFAAIRGDHSERSTAGPEMALRFNDFADAVALMALLELVERYQRDELAMAPRFFSNETFHDVARHCGLTDRLMIRTPDGVSTPVLCNARYFITKASLRQRKGSGDGLDPVLLYDQLDEIFDGSRPGGLEILDQARIHDRSLGQILEDLQEFAFFRNVWLQTSADEELADIVARLNTELEGRQPAVDRAVARVIQKTKDELSANAEQYQELSHAWVRIEEALRRLRAEHSDPRPVEPVRDFKLIRFGLTEGATDKVRKLLPALLDQALTTEQVWKERSWHQLMRSYLRARERREDGLEHAEYVAATLWCLQQYDELAELLTPYARDARSTPVALLYAGACIRAARPQLNRAESVLKPLIARKAKAAAEFGRSPNHATLEAYANLCIGLAYLHFHIFERRCAGWSWRNVDQGPSDLDPDARATISYAIDLAREACDAFTRARLAQVDLGDEHSDLQQKEAYAQNQRLYYLLELGDPERATEIDAAYERLAPIKKIRHDLWLWTFSDTLARYFHFEAVWSDRESDWTEAMDIAQKHISEAVGGGPYDREHELFRDLLARWKRRGFEHRLKIRPALPSPAARPELQP